MPMAGAADMRLPSSSSRTAWNDVLRPRGADQDLHAPGFRLKRLPAGSRQTVVAAPLVRALARSITLLDQGSIHQPLQRPVERPRAQADLTTCLTQDFLQDSVAVPFAARQGEEHVEDGGG